MMEKNILSLKNIQEVYEYCTKVYKLFILGEEEQILLRRLENVEKIPFGNYDSWTWIEPLIMLKSKLSTDSNIKALCRERVLMVLNTGNELQRKVKKNVFQRILNGKELGLDLIENAKYDNKNELLIESYLKTIMQIITIIEMGASSDFSVEKAENLLQKLIAEVKPLI